MRTTARKRSEGRGPCFFFVCFTAKHSFLSRVWLSQTSCLLVKQTKKKHGPLPSERLPTAQSVNGFTLIELMVAIVVVGIITLIAIGFYTPFILKSHRADGMSAILNLQLAEERYRSTNSQYGTLTQIGGSTGSQLGYYTLAVSNVSATAYTITATGQGKQAGDTENGMACSPLTLTVNNGNVTQSPAVCWPS